MTLRNDSSQVAKYVRISLSSLNGDDNPEHKLRTSLLSSLEKDTDRHKSLKQPNMGCIKVTAMPRAVDGRWCSKKGVRESFPLLQLSAYVDGGSSVISFKLFVIDLKAVSEQGEQSMKASETQ